ncbi:MAG TPA: HAMP domain-containing sensor histidine kinase [Gemmatimonadaceae bacterium]|nr:HAMP domain-containing sensor histidine kinase [Gemmatimonadaceae bacterium]
MRRGTPELLVATLILLLLGSYVWYTQRVVVDLQHDAQISSRMFARVYRAIGDTTPGAQDQALLALSKSITDQGVPLVWTDIHGVPAGHANLPFDDPDHPVRDDDPRVRDYVAVLAAEHKPIVDPLIGRIYYGDTRVVRGLRIIPLLQTLTAVILLLAGLYIIRTRGNAARERLWAGMARESAHQLGTPLSSLGGWLELLEENASDPSSQAAIAHMRGDLDRLDRVAHRFERIGREPKSDEIDVGAIVTAVARYFQARVPTLANTIAIESSVAADLPRVRGDAVLVEWAIEVLTKNAIDALAGRGGHVWLAAEPRAERGVVIRVADDGPGIPRELRARVFEPGFSTKKSGWGIGLSLAKRIVEENHGGRLVLLPTERGATFEINLQ